MMRTTLLAVSLSLALATLVRAQDDEGPWLPKTEQKRLLDLMPKGVPVGKNLQFYKLRPVYQKMYTMNNGRSRINDITPVEDVDPWRVSGGLHHVDQKEW